MPDNPAETIITEPFEDGDDLCCELPHAHHSDAASPALATNMINVAELSKDEMLSEYKAQQAAERGFGFLKVPLFFTLSLNDSSDIFDGGTCAAI